MYYLFKLPESQVYVCLYICIYMYCMYILHDILYHVCMCMCVGGDSLRESLLSYIQPTILSLASVDICIFNLYFKNSKGSSSFSRWSLGSECETTTDWSIIGLMVLQAGEENLEYIPIFFKGPEKKKAAALFFSLTVGF